MNQSNLNILFQYNNSLRELMPQAGFQKYFFPSIKYYSLQLLNIIVHLYKKLAHWLAIIPCYLFKTASFWQNSKVLIKHINTENIVFLLNVQR